MLSVKEYDFLILFVLVSCAGNSAAAYPSAGDLLPEARNDGDMLRFHCDTAEKNSA